MQIVFRCPRCFAECKANPSKAEAEPPMVCSACRKPQELHYSEAHRQRNLVDSCAVCQQRDFYVRDEPRKAWGLVWLLAGLCLAYFTYGFSLVLGGFGFYWHFWKYPKLTICYHCYTKYRNCRVNPEHHEYDLKKMEMLEKAIRNDCTFKDFR
jgi:hypothetical protein